MYKKSLQKKKLLESFAIKTIYLAKILISLNLSTEVVLKFCIKNYKEENRNLFP